MSSADPSEASAVSTPNDVPSTAVAAEPCQELTSQPAATQLPSRIVFYDGVCGLCARSVQFLVNADKKRAFRYAPLQGTTAEAVRAQVRRFPRDLDTVVYLEDGKIYLRAQAYFAAAKHLPFPWRMASWLGWLPRWVTDPIYDVVAERRYAMFGKYDVCRVPTREERGLFLP